MNMTKASLAYENDEVVSHNINFIWNRGCISLHWDSNKDVGVFIIAFSVL